MTYVVAEGVYEGRIEYPAALSTSGIGIKGWARYTLPSGESAELTVYDASGRCVFTEPVEGTGRVSFNDMLTPSGIYFVRLERTSGIISRKMVLTR